MNEKTKKKLTAVTAIRATAVARRRQQRAERPVFIQAEKQSDQDRQTAAAEHVRAEDPVFRAENKQSDQNPKGSISRETTIHKNLLCFTAGVCSMKRTCGFIFLLHNIHKTIKLCKNAV